VSDLKGLPEPLADIVHGSSPVESVDVRPGDLWSLSWDGFYLGLALVAAVKSTFVLAWPVSGNDEIVFAPALALPGRSSRFASYVWPTRETGLALDLLHCAVGPGLPADRIPAIAWALEDGTDPGLPFASGGATDPENVLADESMIDRWTALCYHAWPPEERSYFSSLAFQHLGGTARSAADALEIDATELRELWRGLTPPSEEAAARLAESVGSPLEAVLGPDPLGKVVARLANPAFKLQLLEAAASRGLSEGEVRDAVRTEYALAARDDTLAISDDRLRDAIRRVAHGRSPA
jgi:hypothetical protein